MQQNVGKLFKSIADLQRKLAAAQKEVSAAEFEGSAAGGLVRVRISGGGELRHVLVAPAVLEEGSDMVADLVVAAGKHAYTKKEQFAKEKLAAATAGGLPLGLQIPGLG